MHETYKILYMHHKPEELRSCSTNIGEFEYIVIYLKIWRCYRNKKVNVKRWMDDDADFNVNPYTKDSPKEHVFPLNQNLGMFRDVLSVLSKTRFAGAGGGGANTPLTFWRKRWWLSC